MGGEVSILWRRASAGGQLEQPSEVNSSTRMGCASALDISAVEGLFSTCRARPSAVDAVCRNERPKNKTTHADDRAEPHRDMAMILDEKILSGNSHLTGFYADHDALPFRPASHCRNLAPKCRTELLLAQLDTNDTLSTQTDLVEIPQPKGKRDAQTNKVGHLSSAQHLMRRRHGHGRGGESNET